MLRHTIMPMNSESKSVGLPIWYFASNAWSKLKLMMSIVNSNLINRAAKSRMKKITNDKIMCLEVGRLKRDGSTIVLFSLGSAISKLLVVAADGIDSGCSGV